MQVYYNSEGYILIELLGAAMELSRAEAEQLFVDLGHVLQDMDIELSLIHISEPTRPY